MRSRWRAPLLPIRRSRHDSRGSSRKRLASWLQFECAARLPRRHPPCFGRLRPQRGEPAGAHASLPRGPSEHRRLPHAPHQESGGHRDSGGAGLSHGRPSAGSAADQPAPAFSLLGATAVRQPDPWSQGGAPIPAGLSTASRPCPYWALLPPTRESFSHWPRARITSTGRRGMAAWPCGQEAALASPRGKPPGFPPCSPLPGA